MFLFFVTNNNSIILLIYIMNSKSYKYFQSL